ncbi:IS1182 family transposase [Verrucomicrobiota bacterium sgz303538]
MMGRQRSQQDLFSYRINLDHRVRQDHPLRKVRELVDFSFVREEVAHLYGHNGHESVDPEVLLKMMFLLFFDNLPSERELVKVIAERLDYLWFLGYGLDDPIPNHSVLSKARARWGAEVFESLFARTVLQCVEAGLVDGSRLHMDSSLIDANASKNSVRRAGPELIDALRQVYQAQEAKLDTCNEPPAASAPAEEKEQAEAEPFGEPTPTGPVDADTDSEPEAEAGKKKRMKQPVNRTHLSTTDPEASMSRGKYTDSRPRYKVHRAIDDAHGVITAVATTTGSVDDAARLNELRQQHEANTGSRVEVIVADSKYGTVENFISCRHQGITTHMDDLARSHVIAGSRKGIFAETEFHYDAQSDTFTCPAGQKMKPRRLHSIRKTIEYILPRGVCAKCPLREQCTRSKSGRTVLRHLQHEVLEEARRQSASASAKKDRRRRQHLMEGSFADAANNHGFKRARWRRLWRQQIQSSLIAVCQNIRLLIARGTRGLVPAAQVANLIAFPTTRAACGCFAFSC